MGGLLWEEGTKRSYQHWPVPGAPGEQRLWNAQPVAATFELVRLMNVGVPVATSSLRDSRENCWPWLPSCTYMRVLPLASFTTSNADRVGMTAVLSGALTCVHVAPASFERQTPRAYDEAYRIF